MAVSLQCASLGSVPQQRCIKNNLEVQQLDQHIRTVLAHESMGHVGFGWRFWLRLQGGFGSIYDVCHSSAQVGKGSSQSEYVLGSCTRSMANSARVIPSDIPLVRVSHMVTAKVQRQGSRFGRWQWCECIILLQGERKCDQQSNPRQLSPLLYALPVVAAGVGPPHPVPL